MKSLILPAALALFAGLHAAPTILPSGWLSPRASPGLLTGDTVITIFHFPAVTKAFEKCVIFNSIQSATKVPLCLELQRLAGQYEGGSEPARQAALAQGKRVLAGALGESLGSLSSFYEDSLVFSKLRTLYFLDTGLILDFSKDYPINPSKYKALCMIGEELKVDKSRLLAPLQRERQMMLEKPSKPGRPEHALIHFFDDMVPRLDDHLVMGLYADKFHMLAPIFEDPAWPSAFIQFQYDFLLRLTDEDSLRNNLEASREKILYHKLAILLMDKAVEKAMKEQSKPISLSSYLFNTRIELSPRDSAMIENSLEGFARKNHSFAHQFNPQVPSETEDADYEILKSKANLEMLIIRNKLSKQAQSSMTVNMNIKTRISINAFLYPDFFSKRDLERAISSLAKFMSGMDVRHRNDILEVVLGSQIAKELSGIPMGNGMSSYMQNLPVWKRNFLTHAAAASLAIKRMDTAGKDLLSLLSKTQ